MHSVCELFSPKADVVLIQLFLLDLGNKNFLTLCNTLLYCSVEVGSFSDCNSVLHWPLHCSLKKNKTKIFSG